MTEPTPELREMVREYARFAATAPDYKALWEAGNKISALQGQAIGSAHSTLCNIRDWSRNNGLSDFMIDGTKLDTFLTQEIKKLI